MLFFPAYVRSLRNAVPRRFNSYVLTSSYLLAECFWLKVLVVSDVGAVCLCVLNVLKVFSFRLGDFCLVPGVK